MKKTFRFSVKIKGCKKKLHPELPPGVIISQEVEYKATGREFKGGMFARTMMEKEDEILREVAEVSVEEVK